MADLSLADISEKMRDIDFAVLSTRTDVGAVAGRPMSNNRQVEYDGDSFFFTCEDARTVSDIRRDPNVGLTYQSKSGMLGMKPFFITVKAVQSSSRTRPSSPSIGRRTSTPGSSRASTHPD